MDTQTFTIASTFGGLPTDTLYLIDCQNLSSHIPILSEISNTSDQMAQRPQSSQVLQNTTTNTDSHTNTNPASSRSNSNSQSNANTHTNTNTSDLLSSRHTANPGLPDLSSHNTNSIEPTPEPLVPKLNLSLLSDQKITNLARELLSSSEEEEETEIKAATKTFELDDILKLASDSAMQESALKQLSMMTPNDLTEAGYSFKILSLPDILQAADMDFGSQRPSQASTQQTSKNSLPKSSGENSRAVSANIFAREPEVAKALDAQPANPQAHQGKYQGLAR